MDWHNTASPATSSERKRPGSPYPQPAAFDLASLPTLDLSPPGTTPTAGSRLSQMMALSAARPPQATQDELQAILRPALLAQQVEDHLWSDSQQTRLYKCLWTFNPAPVQQMMDTFRQAASMLW